MSDDQWEDTMIIRKDGEEIEVPRSLYYDKSFMYETPQYREKMLDPEFASGELMSRRMKERK